MYATFLGVSFWFCSIRIHFIHLCAVPSPCPRSAAALVLADADSGLGADALARERRRAELDGLLAVVGDHGEGRADVELGVVGALGHGDHVGGEDVLLGHGVGEEEQKEMNRQRTVVVLCVKFSDFSFTHGAEPKGIFVHCCI